MYIFCCILLPRFLIKRGFMYPGFDAKPKLDKIKLSCDITFQWLQSTTLACIRNMNTKYKEINMAEVCAYNIKNIGTFVKPYFIQTWKRVCTDWAAEQGIELGGSITKSWICGSSADSTVSYFLAEVNWAHEGWCTDRDEEQHQRGSL